MGNADSNERSNATTVFICATRKAAISPARFVNALTDSKNQTQFHLRRKSIIFVEICAGSAILSSCAQTAGFYVLPIDHSANRFTPRSKILELDLTNSDELHLLVGILQTLKPDVLHLGLPCGTCSSAREKPIPNLPNAPTPLRDAEYPFGIPNLSELNALKVRQANRVYSAAVTLMQLVFAQGTLLVIENPQRSWLWTVLASLVKQTRDSAFIQWYFDMVPVNFDSCMWGGKRAKATRFLVSAQDLDDMELPCDSSHSHAPWGLTALGHFATADEAEYPLQLCRKYIQTVTHRVHPDRLAWTVKQFRLDTLASVSSQTSSHPQLISDFHNMLWTSDPSTLSTPWKLLPSPPAHATGEETAEQASTSDLLQYVGQYKTPKQHYEEALKLSHPVESSAGVSSELGRAVTFVLSKNPAQVAKFRIDMLRDCIDMAVSLRGCEADTRSGMDPVVRDVTQTKRIEVFKALLADIEFVDMEVVNILVDGVKLTGWEPESDLYTKRYNPPTMTVESLNSQAVWRRKIMLGKSMSSEKRSLAPTLWEETIKEVEAGFLEGPFLEAEVSRRLQCEDWTASKRFLLLQGEEQKPRVIDDLKASGVNAAFGPTSYLNLQNADFLTCFLLFLSKSLTARKVVTKCSGLNELNSAWTTDPGFHGRGVDLSKAYKQGDVFLNLLGWDHATTGKKAVPFASEMTVLGVTFDLSALRSGRLKIFNKKGRIERIIALLQTIREEGRISVDRASVLQGLLNFAGKFVLGRALKRPMHVLSHSAPWRDKASEVKKFCDKKISCLRNLKPRCIPVLANMVPVIVYTDGSWEKELASWGAVIIDRYSSVANVHSGSVPKEVLDHWKASTGEQLICQIELYAYVILRVHYEALMSHRAVIAFIDNEAARHCLIKGSSPSASMFNLAYLV